MASAGPHPSRDCSPPSSDAPGESRESRRPPKNAAAPQRTAGAHPRIFPARLGKLARISGCTASVRGHLARIPASRPANSRI